MLLLCGLEWKINFVLFSCVWLYNNIIHNFSLNEFWLFYPNFSQVKYAPKVSVSVIGGALAGGRIPEGAEVRLSCRSDANPSDVTYRWYINEELVVGDYTTEMVSLSRSLF